MPWGHQAMTAHQGAGCRQRRAGEPRHRVAGKGQNPSFTLPFDLGDALECSVGSGGPTQGSLTGSMGQEASARAKPSCSGARPSQPPEPGSCRFSTPDFLVEVKHVYGSTIGKLEKYQGKIEWPGSCPIVLSVYPLCCFFSQQQGLPR